MYMCVCVYEHKLLVYLDELREVIIAYGMHNHRVFYSTGENLHTRNFPLSIFNFNFGQVQARIKNI